MNKKLLVSLLFPLALMGCDDGFKAVQKHQVKEMVKTSTDENVNFITLADQLFEEQLQLYPMAAVYSGDYRYNDLFVDNLSDDFLKKTHNLNVKYTAYLNSIERDKLSAERKISYDILQRELERALDEESFPGRFIPFTQFSSLMSTMAQLGSGQGAQPFESVENYQQFLRRLTGYLAWFDSAKARLSQGANSKVVLPRVLVNRILPQLQAQIVDDVTQSIFYQPINNMPESFSAEDKAEITKQYQTFINTQLIPAYQDLYQFIEEEYLPHTRATAGYSSLPSGLPWYQFLANGHTTTDMPVEDIHQLGLSEVKRILTEMDKVRQQVQFDGDLKEFFEHLSSEPQFFFSEKQQLIEGYNLYKERIDAVLPQYFDVTPKTPYVVKAVEAFREQSAAGASYSPGNPDGSRPGTFYVNTYNLKAQPKWGMMTLSLHEAAPGHHFQISIQQELEGLPKFQRFGMQTAFIEGWALYSEQLGIEMGLFDDPYQLFGKLADEMLRAMRLVVDTGLHAKGWSRAQAIQYMLDNSAMAKSDVVSEVERYMALPGQALSYKIGQLKIMQLRQYAQEQLGEQFDIKQFHNQVLLDGALPLAILENKINDWVQQTKQARQAN
ncbi:DUF885 domain-containing protein [Alteromonadales bacterium alter-6D02]|nr:DUF885 domain-containing protein [Alteromonadales bacterium alter-6D02]